jgi:hypothetical protein
MANEDRDEKVRSAAVRRPTDAGVDLPAGKKADELDPTDYRAVEMDAETGGTPASVAGTTGPVAPATRGAAAAPGRALARQPALTRPANASA